MKAKLSRLIKVMQYEHYCLRCGCKWRSLLARPTRCGKCKSPYWNKERKSNNGSSGS